MFGRLFGRKKQAAPAEPDPAEVAADEAFAESKQKSLEQVLGPMDDMVFHAVIPFFLGGGLDMYTFSKCIPGTVFATQELVMRLREDRPKPGKNGHFELVACLPPGTGREDPVGVKLINSMLNPTARYASMASLNPGETAEIPGDEGQPSLPILFDRFDPKGVEFRVGAERLHLLLCMALLPSELAFARANGSPALIERLKAANVHPYSSLQRKAVV